MLKNVPTWVKSGCVVGVFVTWSVFWSLLKEYTSCHPEWTGMCGIALVLISTSSLGFGLPLLTIKFLLHGGYGDQYVFVATWIVLSFFIQYFVFGAALAWCVRKILSRMSKERSRKTRSMLRGAVWGAFFGIVIIKISALLYVPIQDLEAVFFGTPIPGGITVDCNVLCDILEAPGALLSSPYALAVFIIGGAVIGFRRAKQSMVLR